jgi:hypothetical protein
MADDAPKNLPEPPSPNEIDELERWKHTRLRRRMLYGYWARDLHERLKKTVGALRKEAWGEPDLSSNVFRASVSQLAVLYDGPPDVTHDDADAAAVIKAVRGSGLWSLQQRVQRDVLGLREMFVRVDIADGKPCFRPVFPDLVIATPDPEYPDRPAVIKEAVLRRDPAGKIRWTYDVTSILGDTPVYQVVDAESGEDLSPNFLVDPEGNKAPIGGFRGETYPFKMLDGEARLPYVLYHASKTGCLFDPYEARELVEGSLTVAVLWTFFTHCVRSASWPQRFVVNARLPSVGLEGDGETQRGVIVADPSVILELESSEESSGQVMASQWATAADPSVMQEAIGQYERRVAGYAGISPADIQRVSGDPRSGYALAISREAQREAQRRFEPQFREADCELLGLAAMMMNRANGSSLPEAGYRLAYRSVPMSADERQAQRDDMLARIDAGLLDKISAYQLEHPGVSDDDAARALENIARINARFPSRIAA